MPLIKDFVAAIGALKIYERRETNDAYCEVVFFSQDLAEWKNVLSSFFGPAAKDRGAKPSKEHQKLTEDYGGIRSEQVLFVKHIETDGDTVIAMLWPWDDGEHITLKIFVT
jgi:hypothetical protein